MLVLTPQEMREIDRITIENLGIPGIVLMENAGREVYHALEERFDLETLSVTVICGKGNNGGDGFVVARYLLGRVYDLKVFLLGSKKEVKGDARFHMELFEKAGGEVEEISEENLHVLIPYVRSADLIVDAIFGTGFRGEVTGLYQDVIEEINASSAYRVSVDIPSGVNGETGEIRGVAVFADLTVTMAYPKTGHYLYPGRLLRGELQVADIGIPDAIARPWSQRELLTMDRARSLLPLRLGDENKGNFGRILVVAGSRGYTGAATMTAEAALRAGAGLVYLATPHSLNPIYEQKLTEVITLPVQEEDGRIAPGAVEDLEKTGIRFDVLAIGPGLGRTDTMKETVRRMIEWFQGPIVIDADAFVLLFQEKSLPEWQIPPVVTPHPGELGLVIRANPKTVHRNRLNVAPDFARKTGTITVLKGSPTVIALPEGPVWINATGNAGMATAGTGDVLTGMIAGFLGQGLDPADAAQLAVYLHGLAGDIVTAQDSMYTLRATDLLRALPLAFKILMHADEFVEEGDEEE